MGRGTIQALAVRLPGQGRLELLQTGAGGEGDQPAGLIQPGKGGGGVQLGIAAVALPLQQHDIRPSPRQDGEQLELIVAGRAVVEDLGGAVRPELVQDPLESVV